MDHKKRGKVMKIFVTGATGVLGKAVVPRLIAGGHAVHALSRSEANREALHSLGAQPIQSDLFDGEALKQALAGCEAILHLATRIAPTSKMAKRASWYENDRIRREGTRTLVEAALAAGGVQTFIYPSYAFVYPDSGDRWIDASTTPAQPTPTLQSTLDAEAAVAQFTGENRHGISLRIGSLYGLESPATHEQLDYARKGIAALPGRSRFRQACTMSPMMNRSLEARFSLRWPRQLGASTCGNHPLCSCG